MDDRGGCNDQGLGGCRAGKLTEAPIWLQGATLRPCFPVFTVCMHRALDTSCPFGDMFSVMQLFERSRDWWGRARTEAPKGQSGGNDKQAHHVAAERRGARWEQGTGEQQRGSAGLVYRSKR